jgi:hypothetical protein
MRRLLTLVAVALLIPLLDACAAAAAAPGGGRSDVITSEEIGTADVSTLYDVVQRLRPQWFKVGAEQALVGDPRAVVVFQNRTLLGGVEMLRQLSPRAADWLQYLDGPKASATLPGLGSRRVEGAIVIHTGSAGG